MCSELLFLAPGTGSSVLLKVLYRSVKSSDLDILTFPGCVYRLSIKTSERRLCMLSQRSVETRVNQGLFDDTSVEIFVFDKNYFSVPFKCVFHAVI